MAPNSVVGGLVAPSHQEHSLRLSQRYWDLDWSCVTPWTFDDIVVRYTSFAEAYPFIQSHYPAIFGNDGGQSRFLNDPLTEAKRRFAAEMDVFLLRAADGATAGVIAGHPTDWSTYYLRTAGFLAPYRDRRLASRCMERILAVLAEAGVERCESECSPANTAMMRMLVGQGFLLTATSNTERWGQLARFTKFLRAEAADIYLKQYCGPQFTTSEFVQGAQLWRVK